MGALTFHPGAHRGPGLEEALDVGDLVVQARHVIDDHPKNFAMLMSSDGVWALAPAYYVAYAEGGPWTHLSASRWRAASVRVGIAPIAQRK